MLQREIVGEVYYETTQQIKKTLQRYKEIQEIIVIAVLGLDKLAEEARQTVARARKLEHFLSQPFFVAEGSLGKYVRLEEGIEGLNDFLDDKYDEFLRKRFILLVEFKKL